jgi:hypothetical protein
VYPAAHVRARLRSPKTWAGPMCRLWSRLTISEWLDLCGIDLYENEVHWLHDKLDELPDLRFQAKETSGQYVAWRIFRDDRAAYLPSFKDLVPRLDFESCRDARFLEKPIKLRKDRFEGFKAHLSEGRVSKIRLLNASVTKRMVSRRLRRQHSVMVRQRVKRFYGVGHDDPSGSTMQPPM